MTESQLWRPEQVAGASRATLLEPDRLKLDENNLPIVEVVGNRDEHVAALAAYLNAVSSYLDGRGLITEQVRLFSPGPYCTLSATMTLRSSVSFARCSAGWHEELGWWVTGNAASHTSGPASCWLGALVPSAHRAAEIIDSAVCNSGERDVPARVLRYRLADNESIITSLRRAVE
jgi:hypothetical protein